VENGIRALTLPHSLPLIQHLGSFQLADGWLKLLHVLRPWAGHLCGATGQLRASSACGLSVLVCRVACSQQHRESKRPPSLLSVSVCASRCSSTQSSRRQALANIQVASDAAPPASHMRAAIHGPILLLALAALQQPRPAAGYSRKNGATQAALLPTAATVVTSKTLPLAACF
jgi:hypothetical protein